MKTGTELIDWVYDIYVQMIVPDEFDQSFQKRCKERDDGHE